MTDRLIPTTYANLSVAAAAATHGDRLVIQGAHPATAISLNLEALNNITIINTSGVQQTANITVGAMKAGAGTIVTGGAGLRLVFGVGTNCEVNAGKSLTTDAAVTFVGVGANGFVGNPTGGTLALNGSRLEGAGGAGGTAWFDDQVLRGMTVTATGCTIVGARSVAYSNNATPSVVTLRRCTATGLYRGLHLDGGALRLTVRQCLLSSSDDTVRASSAGGAPIVDLGACVLVSSGAQPINATVGTPGGTWTTRNCWGVTVDRLPGTWNHNGYTTLASGVGDATDVVTAAPGFVGGGDYHLAAGSPLMNAGTNIGETTDLDGVAIPTGNGFEIGCYAYPYKDCGVDSVTQTATNKVRVTFLAVGAGPQKPLQASAETEGNWTLSGGITASLASRIADLVYDVTLDRDLAPNETLLIDTSAIDTDLGGKCDDPGTGSVLCIYGGLASVTVESATSLLVAFLPGANAVPVEADALNSAKWSTSDSYGSISVTPAKVSALAYRLTLGRPTVAGVDVTVDASGIGSAGGGGVLLPGDLAEPGVQYPNALPLRVEPQSSKQVRVVFDSSAWFSWPSSLATDPSTWALTDNGTGAVIEVESARALDRYTWELNLAVETTRRVYKLDTGAVPTQHGGTA